MTRTFCDRCGQEDTVGRVDPSTMKPRAVHHTNFEVDVKGAGAALPKDLCDTCIAAVQAFITTTVPTTKESHS